MGTRGSFPGSNAAGA